jgi:hypothetical protein
MAGSKNGRRDEADVGREDDEGHEAKDGSPQARFSGMEKLEELGGKGR